MALNKRSLNLLLATGIICIAGGVFLLLCMFAGQSLTTPILIPLLTLAVGVFMIWYAFACYKTVWTIFIGFFLTASCFFMMICNSDMTVNSMKQLWPVLSIICGGSYFASGLIAHKKIHLSNAVFSLVMICMGIFFLLFSMHIITIPFRTFAARWWPLLLIVFGLLLIVVFVYKQRTGDRENRIVYDDSNEV